MKIEQFHDMTYEFLQTKNNIKKLEIHWIKQFLKHHLILKLKFITELEKNHVIIKNSDIIKTWFELMNYHITKNAVEKKNIHIINKKNMMIKITKNKKNNI